MATTAAVKLERERRKTDRDKWVRQILQDSILTPNMIRLAMVAGIIAYSTAECRSDQNVGPVRSALAFALPSIGIPMIAADAGIRDPLSLAAISATGVSYVTGQMVAGWVDQGVIPSPSASDLPWWSLAGPPGWAYEIYKRLT